MRLLSSYNKGYERVRDSDWLGFLDGPPLLTMNEILIKLITVEMGLLRQKLRKGEE